jgi:hypothetical protein
MKIFIASLLLFFTNCLAPTAVSATVNSKTVIAHSVISPVKKLSFKEKLLFKLSKKDGKKPKAFQWILLIGVFFLIVGMILLSIGANSSSFAGFDELLFGLVSGVLGLVLLITGAIIGSFKKKKAPKQVP